MSVRPLRPTAPRDRHRLAVGALALGLLAAVTSACDVGGAAEQERSAQAAGEGGPAGVPEVRVSSTVGTGVVPVDSAVELTADHGTLRRVSVTSAAGALTGELADDGERWRATDRLEPGTRYHVRAVALDAAGQRVVRSSTFRTESLTLDQQTYPSVAPLAGETVGVGMPVIVSFDLPVTEKAAFERHMEVTSRPAQPGSWHWLSDTEAHWRPKEYWRPGTDVTVDVDVNSIDAGNGVYGQVSRTVEFEVGDAHVYEVDARTHEMKVYSNGELLRTLPVTTGKPGFTTRSGTKVIIEKFEEKRMNSETVGISRDDPEAWDIDDVQWAMRLTYSGEFIHAAPWSVGSQGRANVSHGCTGMSTEDAAWLYAMTRRGDVVEYTGTDRPMTLTNGYGDWNASWSDWRSGSALA